MYPFVNTTIGICLLSPWHWAHSVFWEQQGLQTFGQRIQITRPQASQPAFDRHFAGLVEEYGAVHSINLLGTKENEPETTQDPGGVESGGGREERRSRDTRKEGEAPTSNSHTGDQAAGRDDRRPDARSATVEGGLPAAAAAHTTGAAHWPALGASKSACNGSQRGERREAASDVAGVAEELGGAGGRPFGIGLLRCASRTVYTPFLGAPTRLHQAIRSNRVKSHGHILYSEQYYRDTT